jgi:AraC-like DNA-binding protein
MDNSKFQIPYYKDINEFLDSIPSDFRTLDPNLYCLSMIENEGPTNNYKPPFRKDFYFIGLVSNAGTTKITYDNVNVTQLDSFLVFQAPGLIYSFYRDKSANGYLIYFKKDCLSFFKPDFENEFPFFNILHTNFYKLNRLKFREFIPHFEEVFSAYKNVTDKQHKIASAKLLALLYYLKEFTTSFSQWEEAFVSSQQILLHRFVQLVNNFYLEKRTIEEYAGMLNVTPNHLSQSIKSASGKNALSFISERLLTESKSLILFTNFSMAEIAYRLNFSDPANFGKFFKKHTSLAPLDFKKASNGK